MFADPPPESGLHSLIGTSGKPMTLADTDEDLAVHGRIGYGTRTPWLLGSLLVVVVVALGIWSWAGRQDDGDGGGAPKMAPSFALPLLDGGIFRLEDYRGKVVVVNFWASWCDPCKEEMPALQQAAEQFGPEVVFVGIGAKMDRDGDARAFAETYGGGYPLGRDTEGGDRATGTIQLAYGVFGFPSTYVIAPDGTISAVLVAAIEQPGDLAPYIEAARGD